MENASINELSDLHLLRTSPEINEQQSEKLFKELQNEIKKAEWFTIGIMAKSSEKALLVLRHVEKTFSWESMTVVENPDENGPVFLKGNQSSGEIRIRIEHGLGEGVLLTGHNSDPEKPSKTG